MLKPFRFADLRLWSSEAIPELRGHDDGTATMQADDDVVVSWEPDPLATSGVVDWFHRWGETEDWLRFGQVEQTYLLEFPTLVRFSFNVPERRLCISPIGDTPALTVRHLLLNQVLPLVLSRLGRFVLHASAIVVDDAVIGLVGPTGTGKSTLVAACGRLGAPVVADDSLVLRQTDTGWLVVPSYPALRLWPDAIELLSWPSGGDEPVAHYADKRRLTPVEGVWTFEQRILPLRALWTLGGESVPPRPVALELFSQVFRLDVRDAAESARLFHRVADLAGTVPVAALDAGVETRDVQATARKLCAGLRPDRP